MIDLPPPRLTTLDNGLRIVSERMPGLASSSLGVFVGAGARVEAGHEHGIAHLLEHMAFKGTRRLGTTNYEKERPLLEQFTSATPGVARSSGLIW